jgi:hypothetical protein
MQSEKTRSQIVQHAFRRMKGNTKDSCLEEKMDQSVLQYGMSHHNRPVQYSITCFLRGVSLGSAHTSHSNHGFSRTAGKHPLSAGSRWGTINALVSESKLVGRRGITSL